MRHLRRLSTTEPRDPAASPPGSTLTHKRLHLTRRQRPLLIMTFSDGSQLSIGGRNLVASAERSRFHDGQPHLVCNGHILNDSRVSQPGWTNNVVGVSVSQAAGPRGLYLALAVLGWGPGIRRRIDHFGKLEAQHVQEIKTAEQFLRQVHGMLRRDARDHFGVRGRS